MEAGQVIGKGRVPTGSLRTGKRQLKSAPVLPWPYNVSHIKLLLCSNSLMVSHLWVRGRNKVLTSICTIHTPTHTHTRPTHSLSPLWPYCPCCFLQHSLYAARCSLYWNILLLDLCIANNLISFTPSLKCHLLNETFPAHPFKAVPPPAHSICPILFCFFHNSYPHIHYNFTFLRTDCL